MPPKTLTRGSSVAGFPVSVIVSTAVPSSEKTLFGNEPRAFAVKSFQITIVPLATKLAVTPAVNCSAILALRGTPDEL